MARYTGSGSHGQQNGYRHGSGMPNGGSASGVHVADFSDYASTDLHYKMCKKIAQLTKVIYTLNTKADEHESIVEEIEAKHEAQMTKFITDCQNKVNQVKSKVEEHNALREKITSLQSQLDSLQGEKDSHESELRKLKTASQEEITQLKVSHSNVVLKLSKELETLRDKLESQTDEFSSVLQELVRAKDKSLKELRLMHGKETESLKNLHKEEIRKLQSNVEKEKEYLEKLEQIEKKWRNAETLKEIAEQKLSSEVEKLKSVHEEEMTSLKDQLQLEAMEATRNVRESLHRQMTSRELEMSEEREKLQSQVKCNNDEISRLKGLIEQQNLELSEKQGEGRSLREDYQDVNEKLKQSEKEVGQLQKQISSLKNQITELQKEIQSLKANSEKHEKAAVQWEMRFQEAKVEKEMVDDKNKWLESEIEQLTARNDSLIKQMSGDTAKLNEMLENLRLENEDKLKVKDQVFKDEQDRLQSEMQNMRFEFEKKLHDEKLRYENELNKQLSSNTELEDCKTDFERRMKSAELNFERERKVLVEQMERQQNESQAQIQQLKNDSEKKDKALEENKIVIKDLREKLQDLEAKLNTMEQSLNDQISGSTSLEQIMKSSKESWAKREAELEDGLLKLKQSHAQALVVQEAEISAEWKTKLEMELKNMTTMLSSESSKTLSDQVSRVEREKQDQLDRQKAQFEAKVLELQQEIANLEHLLSESRKSSAELQSELQSKLQEQSQQSKAMLEREKNRLMMEMEDLRRKLQGELEEQSEGSNIQLQILEQRLNEEHAKELSKLKLEFTQELDNERNMSTLKMSTEVQKLNQQHSALMEKIKTDASARHDSEVQKLSEGFNQQIIHLKQEVEKANQAKIKLDTDNSAKISNLKDEVSHRNSLIASLESELSQTKESVLRMTNELDFKDKVVQKIRAETEENIRKKQAELEISYKTEIDNIHAEKLREQQKLLHEFSRTRDGLQKDILELKHRVKEAHQKYEDRESRPEDIMQIQKLQEMLEASEEKLKRLSQEKEFFQRELVNRETNFNKVFNASPNVGVLNPFSNGAKSKRGSTGQVNYSSKGPAFSSTSNSDKWVSGGANPTGVSSSSMLPNHSSNTPSGLKLSTPPPGGRLEPLNLNTANQNIRTPTPPKIPKKFL